MRAVGCVVLALVAITLSSCIGMTLEGGGDTMIEERDVGEFNEVEVCCGWRLEVTQGDETKLYVEAPEDVLPDIRTTVSGRKLVVDIDDGLIGQIMIKSPATVFVTSPEIKALSASGGGEIFAGDLDSQALRLELSGGGDALIEALDADELFLDLSGGSQADIAGQVDSQTVDLSGGGQYRAGDLKSADATLNLSGGARAQVWVTDKLDAEGSGGSQIEYYGDARVTTDLSGGSDVRSLGDHM